MHVVLKELSKIYGKVFSMQLGFCPTVLLCNKTAFKEAFVKKSKDFIARPKTQTILRSLDNLTGIVFCDDTEQYIKNRRLTMTAFHRFLRDQKNMDSIMQMEVNKTKEYFDGCAEASSSTTEVISANLERKDPVSSTKTMFVGEIHGDNIERNGEAGSTKTTSGIDILARKGNFYPMDIFPPITLSMNLSMIFGLDLAYEDPDLKHMVSTFRSWFDATEPDNPVDFFPLLAKFPNKRLETVSQTIKEVERFHVEMVKDRVEILMDENNKKNPTSSIHNAILDMIASEDLATFKDEEYCREVAKLCYELIGAGFDTVATALSWAVLYLIENPEVVQRCRAELTQKTTTSTTPLLNNKGEFDDEDLLSLERKTQFPYFMATLFEVLRKSTPSPMGIPHLTKCDTSVQGYHIPKDTTVIPNLRQINNDAEDWPKPHEFRPERFLRDDGSVDTRACNEIATFSAGIRRCPGDKVAITMIFVLLGTLIKRYDFEMVKPPIDMEPMRGLTAKPKHYLVKVNSV